MDTLVLCDIIGDMKGVDAVGDQTLGVDSFFIAELKDGQNIFHCRRSFVSIPSRHGHKLEVSFCAVVGNEMDALILRCWAYMTSLSFNISWLSLSRLNIKLQTQMD